MIGPLKQLLTAVQLHQRGQLDEAKRMYEGVLAAEPENADATHLLGVIAQQQGRPNDAIRLIAMAIKKNSRSPLFYSNLGNAQRDLGSFDDAESSYKSALKLDPKFTDAMINLSSLFILTEEYEKALEWSEKALKAGPNAHALCYRGTARKNTGDLEGARKDLEESVKINPKSAQTWTNLGNVLRDLKDYEGALKAQENAIAINPALAEIWNNRGYLLKQMGNFDEALSSYDRALQIKPTFNAAAWNKSMILLHRDEWDEGFELYELRRKKVGAFQIQTSIPEWNGESLDTKRIAIYAEQGLGDIFQFIRFLDRLIGKGAKVAFACPPNLHRLLKSFTKDKIQLIGLEIPHRDFDFQAPLMSLPHKLKLQPTDASPRAAYFQVEDAFIQKWRYRLTGYDSPRIGLCWQGNPNFPEDGLRSIPLSAFEPLLQIPNAKFFSLQKGFGSEQIKQTQFESVMRDFTDEFDLKADAFLDTAGLIKNLDFVVSVDSAVAHLSGALGCKTYILLPKISDWRWGLEGHDRRWYESVTLIRQDKLFDWPSAVSKLKSAI